MAMSAREISAVARRTILTVYGVAWHILPCERCGENTGRRVGGMVIHHKDENREHNDILNLAVLCQSCHASHHGTGRLGTMLGKQHTPSSRAKMSAVRTGVPKSEAHRKAIGDGNRGKIRSAEFCAKISAGKIGQSHSQTPETKAKIAMALKGRQILAETRERMSAAQRARYTKSEEREKTSLAALSRKKVS